MRNAECGMRNAECGMLNEECRMRNVELLLASGFWQLKTLPKASSTRFASSNQGFADCHSVKTERNLLKRRRGFQLLVLVANF